MSKESMLSISLESKNKTNSTKCILFFVKHGCEAKVKIENHNDHDGINVAKFSREYPALEKMIGRI